MDMLGFGMSAIQSGTQHLGNYIVEKNKAKQDRMWQTYNNTMVKLQNAMNQNSITTNENMLRDRVKQQMYATQISEMETTATAEVSAAATGTVGRSVDMVLLDIGRNAANKRGDIQRDLKMQEVVIDNQRMTNDMQTQMSLDLKQIPSPSAGKALFGFLGDITKAGSQGGSGSAFSQMASFFTG